MPILVSYEKAYRTGNRPKEPRKTTLRGDISALLELIGGTKAATAPTPEFKPALERPETKNEPNLFAAAPPNGTSNLASEPSPAAETKTMNPKAVPSMVKIMRIKEKLPLLRDLDYPIVDRTETELLPILKDLAKDPENGLLTLDRQARQQFAGMFDDKTLDLIKKSNNPPFIAAFNKVVEILYDNRDNA